MSREALGEFLRVHRERADPSTFGPTVGTRRTPGLRRSELAEMANVSEIHYTNIEQARGSRPSADVLASIARALGLDAGERQHLFDLAEQAPPRPVAPSMEVSERTRQLVLSLDPIPVLVCSARLDVIAQNQSALDLLEDFSLIPEAQRNLARRHFLATETDDVWAQPGLDALSRFSAAILRSAQARYPDDALTRDLIQELRTKSARFKRIWSRTPVGFLRDRDTEITRIDIGDVSMACEVTDIPERDQHLVFLPHIT